MQTKNYTNSHWLFFLLVLILFGCNKKFSDILARVPGNLVVNEADFEYLSTKAKIDFDGNNTNISGVANIRIKKDSIIWLSVSPGLGVEVGRVMIDKDSVRILDKINKEYRAFSFTELSKTLEIDVSYRLVESVLLGNLIYPYEKEKLVKAGESFTYFQQHGVFNFESFIGVKTRKLEKVQVADTLTGNTISVNYGDFQLVDEQIFPFKLMAKINYQKKDKSATEVDIEYKQATIEKKPLKFPFNVPQRYEHK